VDVLALVDRKITKEYWWTSDSVGHILCYRKKSAADFACKRLKHNNTRVVPFEYAMKVINDQAHEIMDATYAHPHCSDAHGQY
jgi:hypothetical protein